MNEREPLSRQLTLEEAKLYDPRIYLGGTDYWEPERVK